MKTRLLLLFAVLSIALSCDDVQLPVDDSVTFLSKVEVSGQVLDMTNEGLSSVSLTTTSGGSFEDSQIDGTFREAMTPGSHTLIFSRTGYTTAYQEVYVGDSLPEGSEALLLSPGTTENTDGQSVAATQVQVYLKPVQTLDLSESTTVTLGKSGSRTWKQQHFKPSRAGLFSSIRSKNGYPVKRGKYDGATLDFSKLDPTTELEAMPGPLRTMVGDTTYGLKAVTMMDLTMRDANGDAIQMTDGDVLQTFIKLPERDQEIYRESYESGERVIPLYSFDTSTNFWILEGDAELVSINGEMYAEADISHFSWWSLANPELRGLLRGRVLDGQGQAVPYVQVNLEAIGESFQTTTTTDAQGQYSFYVLRNSTISLHASSGTIEGPSINYNINNQDDSIPHDVDLTYNPISVGGTIVDENSQPISGALVSLKNGTGTYSDANGSFLLNADDDPVRLKVQVISGSLTLLESFEIDLNGSDSLNNALTVDTQSQLTVQGLVTRGDGLDNLPVEGAIVFTPNGEQTTTDADGLYSFTISSTSEETLGGQQVTIKCFTYDAASGRFPELSSTIPLNPGATQLITDFSFLDTDKVILTGRVLVDGRATEGIEVHSRSGEIVITDNTGFYTFVGYAGETMELTAFTQDYGGDLVQEELSVDLFSNDTGEILAEDIQFTLPKATVQGYVTAESQQGDISPLGAVQILSEGGVRRQSASDGFFRLNIAPLASTTLWFDVEGPDGTVQIEKQISALPVNGNTHISVVFDKSTIENIPPRFTTVEIPTFRLATGESLVLGAESIDPDGTVPSELTLALASSTAGTFTVSTVNTAQVTSGSGTKSSGNFQITAGQTTGWGSLTLTTDDGSTQIERRVNIEVVQSIINQSPVLLSLSAPSEVSKNGSYLVAYHVRDPDVDPLTYSFDISPSIGASLSTVTETQIDATGQEVTVEVPHKRELTMNGATTGQAYTITATVDDGLTSLITTTNFTVVNSAPLFQSIEPTTSVLTYDNPGLEWSAQALDPEGDVLTTTWKVSTDEVVFNTVGTGTTYTLVPADHLPTSSLTQPLWFEVEVSDGENATSKRISLSVTPAGANVAVEPIGLSFDWIGTPELKVGKVDQFLVSLLYNNGDQDDVTVHLTTGATDPAIFNVGQGALEPLTAGTNTLYLEYTSNGQTFSITKSLDIVPTELIGIEPWTEQITLVVGQIVNTVVTALYDNNNEQDVTAQSLFFSDNPGIADVSGDQLEAFNPGVANIDISYKENDITQISTLIVQIISKQVESLSVMLSSSVFEIGSILPIEATAIFNDGSTVPGVSIKTTSTDPDIALVESGNLIFPLNEGDVTLSHSYTHNGVKVTSTSNLVVSLPEVAAIALIALPSEFQVFLGNSIELTFNAIMNTGERVLLENPSFDWGSHIGSFDGSVFTGTAIGQAVLTVNHAGHSVSVDVEVLPAPTGATIQPLAHLGTSARSVEGTQVSFGGTGSNIVFFGDGKVLTSLNVNDPANPVELNRIDLPGEVTDLHLDGTRLHASLGTGGYAMIQVLNPGEPTLHEQAHLPLDGTSGVMSMFPLVQRKYSAVASTQDYEDGAFAGVSGINILDVTHPRNPMVIGRYEMDDVVPVSISAHQGMVAVSSYLIKKEVNKKKGLVVRSHEYLELIDMTQPDAPVRVQRTQVSRRVKVRELGAVLLESDKLWVSFHGNLLILDPQNPDVDSPLDKIEDIGKAHKIFRDGDGWSVALESDGLARVIEGSLPPQPQLLQPHVEWGGAAGTNYRQHYKISPPRSDWIPITEEGEGYDPNDPGISRADVTDATILGNVLVMANGYNGLSIANLASGNFGGMEKGLPNFAHASDMAVSGNIVFVAVGPDGLVVLDTTDPSDPKRILQHTEPDLEIKQLAFDHDQQLLYLALNGPKMVQFWKNDIYDHFLLVMQWDGASQTLTEVDRVLNDGRMHSMETHGGRLITRSEIFSKPDGWIFNTKVQVFEEQNQDWSAVSELTLLNRTYQMAFNGNLIAVGRAGDVRLMNTAMAWHGNVSLGLDPNQPTVSAVHDLAFIDHNTLVVRTPYAFHVIDTSDPNASQVITTIEQDYGTSLANSEQLVLVGGGNDTYSSIYDLRDPTDPFSVEGSEFQTPVTTIDFLWEGNRLYAASGLNGFHIFEVLIPEALANGEPVPLFQLPRFLSTVTQVQLDATGSYDPEGDTLSYVWDVIDQPNHLIPQGNTFVPAPAINEGVISDNTASITTYSQWTTSENVFIRLLVSDGDNEKALVIPFNVNHAPVIDPLPEDRLAVGSDNYQSFIVSTSDDDGEPINLTLTSNTTTGVLLSENNLQLPIVGGASYLVELNATDGFEATDAAFNFTFNNIPSTSPIDVSLWGGNSTTLSSSLFNDIDGDSLNITWSLDPEPPAGTVSLNSGDLVITAPLQSGNFQGNITLDDGYDSFMTTFDINVDFSNTPPEILPLPTRVPRRVALGSSNVVSLEVTTYDADGDDVTLSLSDNTTQGISLLDDILYIPALAGSNVVVELMASDLYWTTIETFELLINNPPSTSPISLSLWGGNATILDSSLFTDADGDTLEFSWNFVPASPEIGITFNSGDMVVTAPTQRGLYEGNLTLDDGVETFTTSFDVDVEYNVAPVINSLNDGRIPLGSSSNISMTVTTYDADSDPVVLSLVSGTSPEVTLTGQSIKFPAVAGSNLMVYLSATDGYETTFRDFNFAINNPPSTSPIDVTVWDGNTMVIDASSFTDADGDDLEVTWGLLPEEPIGTIFLSSGNLVIAPTAGIRDYHQGAIFLDDGIETYSTSFSLNVMVFNAVPTVDLTNAVIVTAGENVSLTPIVSDQDDDEFTYSWTHLSGINITMSDNTATNLHLTNTVETGIAQYQLRVSDGENVVDDFVQISVLSDLGINNTFQIVAAEKFQASVASETQYYCYGTVDGAPYQGAEWPFQGLFDLVSLDVSTGTQTNTHRLTTSAANIKSFTVTGNLVELGTYNSSTPLLYIIEPDDSLTPYYDTYTWYHIDHSQMIGFGRAPNGNIVKFDLINQSTLLESSFSASYFVMDANDNGVIFFSFADSTPGNLRVERWDNNLTVAFNGDVPFSPSLFSIETFKLFTDGSFIVAVANSGLHHYNAAGTLRYEYSLPNDSYFELEILTSSLYSLSYYDASWPFEMEELISPVDGSNITPVGYQVHAANSYPVLKDTTDAFSRSTFVSNQGLHAATLFVDYSGADDLGFHTISTFNASTFEPVPLSSDAFPATPVMSWIEPPEFNLNPAGDFTLLGSIASSRATRPDLIDLIPEDHDVFLDTKDQLIVTSVSGEGPYTISVNASGFIPSASANTNSGLELLIIQDLGILKYQIGDPIP
jgi:hypothetical protein